MKCLNQLTIKFELLFSVNLLFICSRSLSYSVCLFVFGDVKILHTINKINLIRLLRVEWDLNSSRTSTQNKNLVCIGNNMISNANFDAYRTGWSPIWSVIIRVISNSFVP